MGEFLNGTERTGEMGKAQLVVQTVSLGAGNEGSIGPDTTADAELAAIREANASPEYARRPSKRWVCVDGRLFEEEALLTNFDQEEADPQIGGGIAVSETAAEFQLADRPQPLSVTIADKTESAIDDGLQVTVHGDEEKAEDGCAALLKLRHTLQYNADHRDVVAPLTFAITGALGINDLLTEKDVIVAIETGERNANNDLLWDATPKEASRTIVEHGGSYLVCVGKHGEKSIRADVTEGAFAKAKFVHDFGNKYGKTIEQFVASFGAYKTETFRRAALHNKTEREAALQVMAVVAFNLGLCKVLSNEIMQADIVSSVKQ